MSKKYFDKYPPFINRVEEQEYINAYLWNAPTSILFLYWPKSTGKTTLIDKIIKELDQKKYAVNYLDMREVLITNFTDFQNLFFPQDLKWKIKEIVSWIKMNVWFFGWDIDDEKMIQTNIFAVMKERLIKANEKWLKPVIILDEFQYLKDIIIEENIREWSKPNLLLVEELFKFFIALTKVRHLAHVICLTSDSYYIEELYNHAKLKNTSEYYLIDHIWKKDVEYWLWDLEKLDEKIVNYFWENLWWSVWEIWLCFLKYKNTWDYKRGIEWLIKDEYAKIFDLFTVNLSEEEKEIFILVWKEIARKWEYIIPLWKNISKMIKKLIEIDVWFYNSVEQKITANSQTTRKAFERMFINSTTKD